MAKQDDYVRTQIRLDALTHEMLKEYCQKNKRSLNSAMNYIIADYLYTQKFTKDTEENKKDHIQSLSKNLEDLTVEEIRDIGNIVMLIKQLKGH